MARRETARDSPDMVLLSDVLSVSRKECGSGISPEFSNQYVIGHFKFAGSVLPVDYTGDSKGFVADLWFS
jgi:hypothetical protein